MPKGNKEYTNNNQRMQGVFAGTIYEELQTVLEMSDFLD